MTGIDLGAQRRERLAAARLYLVCGASPERGELPDLLREATGGGVQVVQLREKQLSDKELLALARASSALCKELGALLIVNDRPLVALQAGADGVHVGQEDMPVEEVRELVGPDMLIGLSTHTAQEIDVVDPRLVDYIGVGPIHATPTKPARPAVGLDLIRYAASHAPVRFFAIGGLHAGNLRATIDAGADSVAVLRAITESDDPRLAALTLRGLLERHDGMQTGA